MAATAPEKTDDSGKTGSWPFVLAALSGVVIFSLEVIWNHLIAAVMGASTYSFSIVLAVVLLSLALAGRQVEKAVPSGEQKALPFIAQALGTLTLTIPLTLVLWPLAGRLLAVAGRGINYFWLGELLKFALAYFLIKPVAAVAGRLFPATFYAISDGRSPSGRRLGWLNMLNALGCVTGALIANYIFIPGIGAERTFELLWGILFILWIVLLVKQSKKSLGTKLKTTKERRKLLKSFAEPAIGFLVVYALIITGGWNRKELTAGYGVYLRGQYYSGNNSKLLYFHEDQHSGFVTVVESEFLSEDGRKKKLRTLLQNGKFDANDGSEMSAQIGLGLLTSLFSKNMERAMVIGLGSGQTAWMMHAMGFGELDICEMSPGHVKAAKKYFRHINKDILAQENVHLHLEDGRNFLARTKKKYDAISIEISSIWFAGASNLYSREFYHQAKEHLAEGGILQQWLQFHHLSEKEIVTVLATVRESFEHMEVWFSGGQAILLASQVPLVLRDDLLDRFLSNPLLSDEKNIYVSENGILNEENFEKMRLFNKDQIDKIIQKIPHTIHTDKNKWLEFNTPLYYIDKKYSDRELVLQILNDCLKEID